jgi:hypothetical protein
MTDEIDLSRLREALAGFDMGTEPEFGNDEIAPIARWIYEHKWHAKQQPGHVEYPRWHKTNIYEPRQRTQEKWSAMLSALQADQNMVSQLDSAGLLQPLNDATRLVAAQCERLPDVGGRAPEPYLTLAVWAAEKFFPRWGENPAPKINEALRRAGVLDEDRTATIRAKLHGEKSTTE